MMAGLDLPRPFYRDAVSPIVADVPHSAALIGPGSEVLGYDDHRSTDHDFGPRLLLLLPDGSSTADAGALDDALAERLPLRFAGRPVRFPLSHDRATQHRVEIARRTDWFRAQV